LYFATAFARVECLGSCGLSKRRINNLKSPNFNGATQREERIKEVKADNVLPVLATSGTVLTKTTSLCWLLKKYAL
jgi:hypothetical protein